MLYHTRACSPGQWHVAALQRASASFAVQRFIFSSSWWQRIQLADSFSTTLMGKDTINFMWVTLVSTGKMTRKARKPTRTFSPGLVAIDTLTPPREHGQLKAIFSRWEAKETTKLPGTEASIPEERIPKVVQKVMNINSAAILFTS